MKDKSCKYKTRVCWIKKCITRILKISMWCDVYYVIHISDRIDSEPSLHLNTCCFYEELHLNTSFLYY